MRLALKNIGKIAEADLVMDGITVIAGENDTGKSTAGKVLYCLFNSLSEAAGQPAEADCEGVRKRLETSLSAEFAGQISSLTATEKSCITFEQQGRILKATTRQDRVIRLAGTCWQTPAAVYIDNPFLLDSLNQPGQRMPGAGAGHREQLKKQLLRPAATPDTADSAAIGAACRILKPICDGSLRQDPDLGVVYQREDGTALRVENLSTGLKTFVMLKTLLQNGTIQAGGTLILDEPEIHLHPQWQLILAELIVCMQQTLGLYTLINTHSPYFLNAAQVYTAKYGSHRACRYYRMQHVGQQAAIEEVTDHIDAIYAELARPLQILEELQYDYNGDD